MKTQASEIKVTYSPKVKAKDRCRIHDSKEAYDLLMKYAFREETLEYKEYAKVILLNKANRVSGIYPLSEGGMDSTVIDVRLILQVALLTHSSAFMLAHNHTSGRLQPSMQDNAITEKVRDAQNCWTLPCTTT